MTHFLSVERLGELKAILPTGASDSNEEMALKDALYDALTEVKRLRAFANNLMIDSGARLDGEFIRFDEGLVDDPELRSDLAAWLSEVKGG